MANELTPLFPEKSESSDKDDESDSKKKNRGKPVPPRILNLGKQHEGVILPSRPPEEARLLRAPVFGELVGKKPEDDDDDDDEDEEKDDKPAVATDGVATEPAAAETSADQQSDEFESIMQQMGSEYTAATSGEQLTEPEEPEEEAEPTPEAAEIAPELASAEQDPDDDTEDQPVASASPSSSTPPPSSSSGSPPTPPPPPGPPSSGAGFNQFQPMPGPNWNAAPAAPNVSPAAPQLRFNQAPTPSAAQIEYEKKKSLRLGLVAGFLTGYVVKAYIAHRKLERFERESQRQLDQRDEQIDFLQAEQHRTQEKAKADSAMYERERYQAAERLRTQKTAEAKPAATGETLPSIKTASNERLLDEQGNEIILQPGWRVERSPGGYSAVLDEHNRVVYEAINYGEAFRRDRRPELVNTAVFGDEEEAEPAAVPAGGGLEPLPHAPGTQFRPDIEHQQEETNLIPEVDIQHRLPEPRNQLLATVISPWLWTAVAILLIVYFVAALA